LVPDLPYEVRFDHRTDMRQLAAALCDGLDLALAEMERLSTTKQLVRYAVDNNLLIEYDKTCRYLAAIDDIETLTEYVTTLHNCFGRQDRWSIFDRNITTAVGRWALGAGAAGARRAWPDYRQWRVQKRWTTVETGQAHWNSTYSIRAYSAAGSQQSRTPPKCEYILSRHLVYTGGGLIDDKAPDRSRRRPAGCRTERA